MSARIGGEGANGSTSRDRTNYYQTVPKDALEKMMQNRTSIVIAHRLSTIRHADRIYVLEKGNIIEQGKHEDLLVEKGLYYAMWRQQVGERLDN